MSNIASSGELVKGWQLIGGTWYYFDTESYWMYSDGIWRIDGVSYRFKESGAMVTGWYEETWSWTDEETGEEYSGNNWYYYTSSGKMATGWQQIGGTWYYFAPEGGWMYADGVYGIGGTSYFFYKSGAMGIGWCKETWSWTDEESGEEYSESNWYYANSDGSLRSGWQLIGGTWYMFDEDWHQMYTGWYWDEVKETWYLFAESGAMVTGWYLVDTNEWEDCLGNKRVHEYWAYQNSDGTAYEGWLKSGGNWYYIVAGDMISLDTVVDEDTGKTYYLQENGVMCTTPGWVQIVGRYNVGWIYVKNSSGELQTGWKTINNKEYYFAEESIYDYNEETEELRYIAIGEMLYSIEYTIGDYVCTFDEEGACISKVAVEE